MSPALRRAVIFGLGVREFILRAYQETARTRRCANDARAERFRKRGAETRPEIVHKFGAEYARYFVHAQS